MKNIPLRDSLTPMMQQWHDCKVSAGSALLLFRMGDFYEAFFDDAEKLATTTGINLTKRAEIPMSGIPHHQLDNYLNKLINAKVSVAIAEQFGDPKAKGLVERKIARIITPGTLVNPGEEKLHNTIAALCKIEKHFGFAYCDITTSELYFLELDTISEAISEIIRLRVVELLTPPKFFDPHVFEELSRSWQYTLTDDDKTLFSQASAKEMLERHLGTTSLDSFGMKQMPAATTSAGALITFARHKLGANLSHIKQITHAPLRDAMAIDRITEKNLELFISTSSASSNTSLFHLLDKTATPMGGRLLRRWLMRPLLNIAAIEKRQEAVAALFANTPAAKAAHALLKPVRDLERLIMRISTNYATPKDLATLKISLFQVAPFKESLSDVEAPLISNELKQISQESEDIAEMIDAALVDDPPWRLSDGGLFRSNYNSELDELKRLTTTSGEWLTTFQEKIREENNIKNLKVSFNRVFGYYIEVSRTQAHLMPEHFTKTQTLSNSERFTNAELKAFEEKVLHAEEQISKLETKLFHELREKIAAKSALILQIASSIAKLDTVISLALVALEQGYCRPTLDDSTTIDIEAGRHPVVESAALKTRFIPNDTHLDGKTKKLILLTGPNMGGKSTYIRQTAIITLLAQIGSFVPATKAHIGIVDRLFSRIGAADDLARGQSTFMVEMAETANILNNMTERSLILLDEIGRGTSTCDGIAIAKAVAEALLAAFEKGPRTLFATHFFELTALEKEFAAARNAHVSVAEANGSIVFLHKIAPGACTKSYGVHVARIAGVPASIIARAEEILSSLESGVQSKRMRQKELPKKAPSEELLLFDA